MSCLQVSFWDIFQIWRVFNWFFFNSKSALIESLEIDQYMWAILNNSTPDTEEVAIDSEANWKSSLRTAAATPGIKVDSLIFIFINFFNGF